MASITLEEEAGVNEVLQLLEAQSVATTSSNPLVADNIPAQREKLALLVSTGKSKEAIGVHQHMIRLNAFPTKMYKNTRVPIFLPSCSLSF